MLPTFKGGADMGLFDLFNGRKKADLLALQKIVLANSPDKLIMSEKQLKNMAYQMAENSLRIVQDCSRLLQATVKPEVFFERLQLMILHSSNLAILENHVPFGGSSPTVAFNTLMAEKQDCINQFLVRYFTSVFEKAEGLKTEKGKLNQYQKFYDSLKPYFVEMDANNMDYIETKYRAYTRLYENKKQLKEK
jgi:hypothetical protein